MKVTHRLALETDRITMETLLGAYVANNVPEDAVLRYDHFDEEALIIEWGDLN